MNVVALIFGAIAVILYAVTLLSNKKKTILIFLILTNIFWSLQYLMLNAYSGLYMCVIAIIRTVVYLKYENSNRKVDLFTMLVFIGLYIFGGVLAYDGIISMLPVVGTCIYTIYLTGDNIKRFKYVCIGDAIFWIIYNVFVQAYVGILSSVVEIITASYSIYKLKKHR